MNSKQRILNTINHKSADRIPINFSANKFVIKDLKERGKINSHIELLKHTNSDIVDLRDCVSPDYIGTKPAMINLGENIQENYWGWRTRIVKTHGGWEEQFCDFKLKDAATIADLENYDWPSPDWFSFQSFQKKLEPYKELAIMASGGSVFQHPTFLRGMDNFLLDLAINPQMAEFIMDKFTNFYLTYFKRMFEAAKGQIDIFRVADDLGMQTGLMISHEMFDQFVAPRLKKMVDLAHDYGIKFMLHSCGDISTLIPRLIDIGIDILDPIQVSATNMDLVEIHKKFGDKICLHGGIDTQQFLPNASPLEVKGKIRGVIDYFRDKTGYIISTSHVIEGDIPLENIDTLFNEGVHFQIN